MLIAGFSGINYLRSSEIKLFFYQIDHAPAVMEALGNGFINPKNLENIPGLVDFLLNKASRFNCNNIPENIEKTNLCTHQSGSKYLMGFIALN